MKLFGGENKDFLASLKIEEYEKYFGVRVFQSIGSDNVPELWGLYKDGNEKAFFQFLINYISSIPENEFDSLDLSQLIEQIATGFNSHAKEKRNISIQSGVQKVDQYRQDTNSINREIHLVMLGESKGHINIPLRGRTNILRKCIKIQAELYLNHTNNDLDKNACIEYIKQITK